VEQAYQQKLKDDEAEKKQLLRGGLFGFPAKQP